MTIVELLQYAKQQLRAVAENPTLEAEILLAYVLQKPRSYLYMASEQIILPAMTTAYLAHIARRQQKEPIAYITNKREFWSLELEVNSATLIPRPETELLIETMLTLFPDRSQAITIADLGTGSGAIALALAHEYVAARIVAVDISQAALQVAENNAKKFNKKNISFFSGHWCEPLVGKKFDVIVSNPPYIAETEWVNYEANLAYEPYAALVSGQHGLEAISEIVATAKQYLQPNGYLLVEHGFTQAQKVREIFTPHYQAIRSLRDLAGHERVTVGQFSPAFA